MALEPSVAEGPRFAPISGDDHGGVVAIISTLLMVWMLLCLAIRVYIRISISGGFGLDDYVLAAASTVAAGHTVAMLMAVNRGFGKALHLLDEKVQIPKIEEAFYASDILFVIGVTLGKCAVCLLITRLRQTTRHSIFAYSILGVSILWGFASIIAIAVRDNRPEPWALYNEDPSGLIIRWKAVSSFDVIIEVALSALSIVLVWSLQMPIKLKVLVIAAFSFRLTVVIAIIARVTYLDIGLNTTDNPFFALVNATVCTEVELHWGLMAASIPCLKPFMRAANTGYLGFSGAFIEQRTGGGSYAMTSMKGSNTTKSNIDNAGGDITLSKNRTSMTPGNFPGVATWTKVAAKPGQGTQGLKDINKATTRHHKTRSPEDGSSISTNGSETKIIHQTREWTVEYYEDLHEGGGNRRREEPGPDIENDSSYGAPPMR